jgi:hypothetical protein
VEAREARGSSGLKCSQDKGLTQDRVKQLGVVVRVLEPIPVTGGEDDRIPDGTRRD